MEKFNSHSNSIERRCFGVHLTSSQIFLEYIFPEIRDKLMDFIWIDLFCGKGNLILPILNYIPKKDRNSFFKEHIFLSDIQEKMIKSCYKTAQKYGISLKVAEQNIICRDNLESFPTFLKEKNYPLYHITNPPYLYLGFIRKNEKTKNHLKYFNEKNKGYQDLYQIAMINDLRNNIKNLIYIIPSNFIYGATVSNKFRLDFLKYYNILKMLIFETQIFRFTGTNIFITFLKRKSKPNLDPIIFEGIKYKKNNIVLNRKYYLEPEFKYRGGSEFDKFLLKFRSRNPLKVQFYLKQEDIKKNIGDNKLSVIDTSHYKSGKYLKKDLYVNNSIIEKVKSNNIYVKTVDSGSNKGRVGLYEIKEDFGTEGIYVSGDTYRTSPIQIFLLPTISKKDQELLLLFFNYLLEHFRKKLDSEFLTTYKYSNADYTRKYLGLTQVRKLIKTFPIIEINEEDKHELKRLIKLDNNQFVKKILKNIIHKI